MFLSVYNFRNNTQKFSSLKSLTLKNKNKRVKIKEGYLFQISSAYQKYYIISQVFLCFLTNSKGTQNGGKGQRLPLTITHYFLKHTSIEGHLTGLEHFTNFETLSQKLKTSLGNKILFYHFCLLSFYSLCWQKDKL